MKAARARNPAPKILVADPHADTATARLYDRSEIGSAAASDAEQWDDYRCPNGCGRFRYRQRTRKLGPA